MTRGKFITLEGTDAAGKSTQAALLAQYIETQGFSVIQTREPGGTQTAERIRDVALHSEKLDPISETLLMFAARREHIVAKIEPALAAGTWIICDRFTDSTYAYQGGGRGVPTAFIAQLAQQVQGAIIPDLTLYLHSPPASSSSPLFAQETFEREDSGFYSRVCKAYEQLAKQQPARIVTIKNSHNGRQRRSREDIADEIHRTVARCLLPNIS